MITSKLLWALIFTTGTASGGSAAFFLPERLWSNAEMVMFYKKGDKADDNSTLKVGGDGKNQENKQNTESIIRFWNDKWEDQSYNYGITQNNSLWLFGRKNEQLKNSTNWHSNMNKRGEKINPSGSLSFYFKNIDCNQLNNIDELNSMNNNASKIKSTCQNKPS